MNNSKRTTKANREAECWASRYRKDQEVREILRQNSLLTWAEALARSTGR